METVNKPFYTLIFNGAEITTDLAGSALSIGYSDKASGESDEISLALDDSKGLWRYQWKPDKRDTIEFSFGIGSIKIPAGVFQVDQMEFGGPPDVVTIKGLAVPIDSPLRTRASRVHEGKTIKEIVEAVADRHNLAILGDFNGANTIGRVTQYRETDLTFLARLAAKYGYIVNIRGGNLIFTSIYVIEGADHVLTLGRKNLTSYSFADKSANVYTSAKVSFQNPELNETIEAEGTSENEAEATEDVLKVYEKAESQGEAVEVARARLYDSNTAQVTGRLSLPGNPLFLSGSNIMLTEMGRFSGIFQILSSEHTFSPGGGYTTQGEIKRVRNIEQSLW